MPIPLSALLSLGERAKEPRGPADVGALLGGLPARVESVPGDPGLLGSHREFGQPCPPAAGQHGA